MPEKTVLFVINDLSGGGAEKALVLLADYLVTKNNYGVTIVKLQSGEDAYQVNEKVEVLTLPSGPWCRGIMRLLLLPVQARQIAGIVRRKQPDWVHSLLPRANIATMMAATVFPAIPAFIAEQNSTADSYPDHGLVSRWMRLLIRRYYPRANHVFPSSEGVLQGLIPFGIDPQHTTIFYNSVNLEEIDRSGAEPTDVAFPADSFTFITIGRLVPQKDHATLLQAFKKVHSVDPKCRLLILGEGPLRSETEKTITSLGLADKVQLLGWRSNPFALLAGSDCFVLSSIFEGFGNVIIEAMASGLPVVATDCPSGPREILQDGEAGILVPVRDPDQLAGAMRKMMEDEELRNRLKAASRLRAKDFSIAINGEHYLRTVHNLID